VNVIIFFNLVNTFCDFETFVEVCYGSIKHYKKLGLIGLEFPELFRLTEHLAVYIASKNSSFITLVLKEYYKAYLSKFEENGMKFKVIDAIEQSASFDMAGSLFPELKKLLKESSIGNTDSGVFNTFHLKSFPNLVDRGDDMNLSKSGPFMPINPLKAHKANPTFNHPTKMKTHKINFSRGRVRLFKGFCTLDRPTYYH
jgi:hypothetical protein